MQDRGDKHYRGHKDSHNNNHRGRYRHGKRVDFPEKQQIDLGNNLADDNFQQQHQIFSKPLNEGTVSQNTMEIEETKIDKMEIENSQAQTQASEGGHHSHKGKHYSKDGGYRRKKDDDYYKEKKDDFHKEKKERFHNENNRRGGDFKPFKHNSFPKKDSHLDVPFPDLTVLQEIQALPYNDDEVTSKYDPVGLGSEIEESTRLHLKLKNKLIQADPEGWQTFPLLVTLQAADLKSSHRPPVDLICVIDRSGSMAGTKMKLVQNALECLLNYLTDADRLSIVLFESTAVRLFPLKRTTQENKTVIYSEIQNIKAMGGTNINHGMMQAFQIFNSRRYKNPAASIFLLSDGLDNSAKSSVRVSLDKFNIAPNVTINTFGFGADHDPHLMSTLADYRDGNFYFVENLEKINECFIDCLGGILSSISQDVVIKVKTEQSEWMRGVQLLNAYGNESMWEYQKGECATKLINLMSGSQKDYILKLRIPAIKKSITQPITQIKIASAEAVIVGLDNSSIIQKADLYIDLVGENSPYTSGIEDDKDVMRNYYRVKGAFLMDKARQLADEKQWIAARKSLQSFKDEVETSFLKEDPFVKNLLVDLGNAIRNVDPDVYRYVGKHKILANQRAQMYQKSNFDSGNSYQNSLQKEMLKTLQQAKPK